MTLFRISPRDALGERKLEGNKSPRVHRRVAEVLKAVHVNLKGLEIAKAGLEQLPLLLDHYRKVGEVGVVEESQFRDRAVALLRFLDFALAPFLDPVRRTALLDPFFAELFGQDLLDQVSQDDLDGVNCVGRGHPTNRSTGA